jgi:hypothetical protein
MTLAKLGRVVRLSYQNWRMTLMGASESFMNHPASVRCWPIREAWEADSSVSDLRMLLYSSSAKSFVYLLILAHVS